MPAFSDGARGNSQDGGEDSPAESKGADPSWGSGMKTVPFQRPGSMSVVQLEAN